MKTDRQRTPRDLLPHIDRLFSSSAGKTRSIEASWQVKDGAPVPGATLDAGR